MLIKRHAILFCNLQNMKKQLSVFLFLCLSLTTFSKYCQKIFFKSRVGRGAGSWEKYIKGGDHVRRGLSIE